jgi:hypothetical protein
MTDTDSTLLTDLESLMEPANSGDTASPPLRWTTKGLRNLSEELEVTGHKLSHSAIGNILKELGYSLQNNVKTMQRSNDPDRNAQFAHINAETALRVKHGHPVISLNTKKLEYSNARRVNAVTDHHTQVFAVQTIRCWWQTTGSLIYPHAKDLLIIGDDGGNNGPLTRLWKLEIQNLADEIGLPISFCYFPAGTYKWRNNDNRISSCYNIDWHSQARASHEVLLNPITKIVEESDHQNQSWWDTIPRHKMLNVPDEEFFTIDLVRNSFYSNWNYTIRPRQR